MRLVSLEELVDAPAPDDPENDVGNARVLARLETLIRRLIPPDDQVMLLYLEDHDGASIAEITGLSASAVATRIHRIKHLLRQRTMPSRSWAGCVGCAVNRGAFRSFELASRGQPDGRVSHAIKLRGSQAAL